MKNDEEIDPIKLRTGLFAIITARLEDAHQVAVIGQSGKTAEDHILQLLNEFRSATDEIRILLDAIEKLAQ